MNLIRSILDSSPEIALFFSVGLGYLAGKFKVGSFTLGGVAGSLLVAVAVSQIGINIGAEVGSVLFALFIYAVGFQSGPGFLGSLGRKSLREIVLAFFLAATALATVVVLARWFHINKGLAAGIAAGGLTQSAIIGTAGSALAKLGLPAAELHTMQGDVAIGYAVTYIFGSLGPIFVCVSLLPLLARRSLRQDAEAAAQEQSGDGYLGADPDAVLRGIIGKVYRVGRDSRALSSAHGDVLREIWKFGARVERIKREGKDVRLDGGQGLRLGDLVLLAGSQAAVERAGRLLGEEDVRAETPAGSMNEVFERRLVEFKRRDLEGKPWVDALGKAPAGKGDGVWLLGVRRGSRMLDPGEAGAARRGDVAVLYGAAADLACLGNWLGASLSFGLVSDLIYQCLGIAVGLLLGWVVVRIDGIPLTLGAGGGALISGLAFGWWHGKHPSVGAFPPATCSFLVQFGLAGFVAVVGLRTGGQAIATIAQHGMIIFVLGCVVTIVPLLLTMLFGWFVLRYRNVALFAGALAGARSANPALGEVLNAAGNSVPTAPFAITYALANVLLTLLGPLVVALV